ncbi:blue light sensor protein, partial [Vibrio genomosp. F6]
PQSHLTALLNLQFSGSDQFSPYDMSGESAYLMLLELKQNLPSE